MCVSLRQAGRLWKRYRQQSAAGLIQRFRGRASNLRLDKSVRERIVKRYQERYADVGPTPACEKLSEDKLRSWLMGGGDNLAGRRDLAVPSHFVEPASSARLRDGQSKRHGGTGGFNKAHIQKQIIKMIVPP
jgi:hypothetical protein